MLERARAAYAHIYNAAAVQRAVDRSAAQLSNSTAQGRTQTRASVQRCARTRASHALHVGKRARCTLARVTRQR
eukprot:11147383-Lingulodinium_polyedra.AAC.1